MTESAAAAVIDLWSLLADPPAEQSVPLRFGHSTVADVAKLLGVRASKLKPKPGFAEGWQHVAHEDFFLTIDPAGHLQGISFGAEHDDHLPWMTAQAIVGHDSNGIRLAQPAELMFGNSAVRLSGGRLGVFATLPRLTSFLSNRDLKVQFAGRDYDKWVRISIALPNGVLTLEYLLKTVPIRFTELAQTDFCLHSISAVSKAALAS